MTHDDGEEYLPMYTLIERFNTNATHFKNLIDYCNRREKPIETTEEFGKKVYHVKQFKKVYYGTLKQRKVMPR